MLKTVKRVISKNARFIAGSATVATCLTASSAFAVGVADAGVTGAFTGMGDNIVATMGTVAPFAIGVMACILGFKYGKKIFKVIAAG